ncbi:hypothetical protein [Pseudoduganella sp.]|uniref:hypothetical protein n=1 Tax=Pseudoduganella sp. TaxID=1880898 RepID=UPI0035B4490A
MNVNAIGGGNYISQVSSGSDKARPAPPAPPPGGQPPGAEGFINAIGEALQTLGAGNAAASGKEDAASAMGSFLQQLMDALHEQGAGNGAQAEGGFAPGGGPGRLAGDLQSLAASLQGEAQDGQGGALGSSFSALLDALGVDSSDAGGKLAGFLQALADKLPQSGSSGNLVNTSA